MIRIQVHEDRSMVACAINMSIYRAGLQSLDIDTHVIRSWQNPMTSYSLRVYRANQLIKAFELSETVTIGRRDVGANEPAAPALFQRDRDTKLIVAEGTVAEIPRIWFRVACEADGQILIENLHAQIKLSVDHQPPVSCGEKRTFNRDLLIDLGAGFAVRVSVEKKSSSAGESLRQLTNILTPRTMIQSTERFLSIQSFDSGKGLEIAKMLQLALGVVQEAAGSDRFFQAAVDAALQIVGLDRVLILLRNESTGFGKSSSSPSCFDGWSVMAEKIRDSARPGTIGPLSRTVFQRTIDAGSTQIFDPGTGGQAGFDNAQSLMQVCCATAAPILDHERQVLGVLYGDRWTTGGDLDSRRISDLEATIIEVLASAMAGGIARQIELRRRTALSGFFSPRVADLLANHPEMMDGQDVEISVLFCDVRGFSSVTEKLGPKKAIEWINDVMTELSQCVIDRDGVLVDYMGDELFAMWGAPGSQPDHASRAFEAARAMLAAIENLRTRWSSILPSRFGAGIGINTGPARVGNVGSRQKFKYGALGNTVNVGARLQTATKQLGIACLVSSETIRQAKRQSEARRLARLGVQGIEESIEVYEVVEQPSETWRSLTKSYEQALADFEAGRFGEATQRLGELLQKHPSDAPSKKLLSRAVQELDEPTSDFSGVWRLLQK